jgi:hypothetical protein
VCTAISFISFQHIYSQSFCSTPTDFDNLLEDAPVGLLGGEFRTGNSIKLEKGFSATPAAGGVFFTTIDPDICGVTDKDNSAKIVATDTYHSFLNNPAWFIRYWLLDSYLDSYVNYLYYTLPTLLLMAWNTQNCFGIICA